MNFKVFVEETTYQPIITLTFIEYWRNQNREFFGKLFEKLIWKKLFPKFLRKRYHGSVITLMLVAWWCNQNKKICCFNTDILLLGKPLITEIFEVFMEGAICEPMITLTLMTSNIRIRKSIFVRVLVSFLDLINSLWLKLAL